jgi:hypothetical protein
LERSDGSRRTSNRTASATTQTLSFLISFKPDNRGTCDVERRGELGSYFLNWIKNTTQKSAFRLTFILTILRRRVGVKRRFGEIGAKT